MTWNLIYARSLDQIHLDNHHVSSPMRSSPALIIFRPAAAAAWAKRGSVATQITRIDARLCQLATMADQPAFDPLRLSLETASFYFDAAHRGQAIGGEAKALIVIYYLTGDVDALTAVKPRGAQANVGAAPPYAKLHSRMALKNIRKQ